MKSKITIILIGILGVSIACSEPADNDGDMDMAQGGQAGLAGSGGTMPPNQTDQGSPVDASSTDAIEGDMSAPRMGITIPLPASLAADTATVVCRYLERCNYNTIAEEVLNEPCLQMIERQMEDAVVSRLSPLQNRGELSFNPQGNRACLMAIETLPCSLDFTALSRDCTDGFDGLVPVGEGCTDHEVCEGDAFCDRQEECPGTCQPRASVDETCTVDVGCQAGMTCVRGTCQSASAVNGECGGDGPPCEAGLYCTGENGGAGRCQTYDDGTAGQSDECDINAGPLCGNGLACVVDAGLFGIRFTCENRREENQRCRPGLPDQCRRGLYCADTDINAQDIEGVCRAAPGDGQPCGEGPVFQVCAAGLVCDDGLCTPRSRLGERCAQNETCYSGFCDNEVCVAGHLCPLE